VVCRFLPRGELLGARRSEDDDGRVVFQRVGGISRRGGAGVEDRLDAHLEMGGDLGCAR
jgi:hypothetical protein